MTMDTTHGTTRELRCREVAQIVQSFLDGELPRERAHEVAHHLDRCRDCGIEADKLRRVTEAIADLRIVVDPEVLARLRRSLDDVTR